MSTASCFNIEPGVLADYWLEALTQAEEEAIEEHLLACDRCGDRLREIIAIAEGIRSLAREGSLRMIVSEIFLRRASEDGLHVRQYAPAPGGSVQCTVTAEDDLLVGRLAANLSGAKRVDLCLCDARGIERLRMTDIPFHAASGGIALQESITLAKASASNT